MERQVMEFHLISIDFKHKTSDEFENVKIISDSFLFAHLACGEKCR